MDILFSSIKKHKKTRAQIVSLAIKRLSQYPYK